MFEEKGASLSTFSEQVVPDSLTKKFQKKLKFKRPEEMEGTYKLYLTQENLEQVSTRNLESFNKVSELAEKLDNDIGALDATGGAKGKAKKGPKSNDFNNMFKKKSA